MAAGKTGAEIASSVGISLPSVQNIKKALGLVKPGSNRPGTGRVFLLARPPARGDCRRAMSTAFIQANTNGRLHPADEPSLPPLNRGYLYGDAIYEVWRTYGGVLFAWEEHCRRLRASAAALHLELPLGEGGFSGSCASGRRVPGGKRACRESSTCACRFQRGGGPIGLDTALADQPDFVILVQPCPELTADKAGTA